MYFGNLNDHFPEQFGLDKVRVEHRTKQVV